MGVPNADVNQLRDSSFKVIPGTFPNLISVKENLTASYEEVDLEQEVAGLTIYATEPVLIKINGDEHEFPKEVVFFLPVVLEVFEIKQGASGGILYAYGGH